MVLEGLLRRVVRRAAAALPSRPADHELDLFPALEYLVVTLRLFEAVNEKLEQTHGHEILVLVKLALDDQVEKVEISVE